MTTLTTPKLTWRQRLTTLWTGVVPTPVVVDCRHDFTHWTNPEATDLDGLAVTGAGPSVTKLQQQTRRCIKCNFNQRAFS